jgi:hypothetical protein
MDGGDAVGGVDIRYIAGSPARGRFTLYFAGNSCSFAGPRGRQVFIAWVAVFFQGEVAERLIVAVSKTVEGNTSGGSNPPLSAQIS